VTLPRPATLSEPRPDGRGGYAYDIREGDRIIGGCELLLSRRRPRRLQAKMWLDAESDRGRGIGTHALTALVDSAFGVLAADAVWGQVAGTNTASLRCAEKVGFVTYTRQYGVHFMQVTPKQENG